MDERLSLRQLFEKNRAEFENGLEQFNFTDDTEKIQLYISDYFKELLDARGEYRQQLTISEDYIFQSGISLLNAHQEIALSLLQQNDNPKDNGVGGANVSPLSVFIGSTGGALVGNIFGGWGAVIGAAVGTAVSIYRAKAISGDSAGNNNKTIGVDTITTIIGKVLDSLDNLVGVFRAQIKGVENKKRPSLEEDFEALLSEIQSLAGYRRGKPKDEHDFSIGLCSKVDELTDHLMTYGLTLEDYDGGNKDWFDCIPSERATETRQVFPAVIKGEVCVSKGRVFVPKNEN